MESIILIVHVLLAISVIALVLLQQGKGADMGASFGAGASQTVFGSSGSGNFMTRATAILATCFFVTSFALAIVAKDKSAVDANEGIPEAVTVEQVDTDALPEMIDEGLLEEKPADASLPDLD
jgi:preprotein translocase subunit SecG